MRPSSETSLVFKSSCAVFEALLRAPSVFDFSEKGFVAAEVEVEAEVQVKALYDYQGAESDELTFNQGMLIYNVINNLRYKNEKENGVTPTAGHHHKPHHRPHPLSNIIHHHRHIQNIYRLVLTKPDQAKSLKIQGQMLCFF